MKPAIVFAIAFVFLALATTSASAQESTSAPTFVLVGATGNLAKKYLWQILFELYLKDQVSYIVGGATKPKEKGQGLIDSIIAEKVSCEAAADKNQVPAGVDCAARLSQFKKDVQYSQLRNDEQYGDLSKQIDAYYASTGTSEAGRFFYLSVSPDFYPAIAKNINTLARPKTGWLRAIFEKPFGRDTKSAQELSDTLTKQMQEDEIYRIDHYLGKRSVRDIGAFRLANRKAYDGILNKDFVESVEVVQKETEDVEGRTWFYDNYGAVRDLLQNHLTEVLAMTIADLPEEDGKGIDRFKAIASITGPSVHHGAHKFGQYDGYIKHVREDKKDASATSAMPTAAYVELQSQSPRWAGVKLSVAHGKALDERVAFSKITFKPGVCSGRSDGVESKKCEILFHLQGGKLQEHFVVSPGLPPPVFPKGWAADEKKGRSGQPSEKAANPYFTLINAALAGDKTLFCSTDELMALWGIWTPLLGELEADPTILQTYQPGEANFAVSSGREMHDEL